MKKVFIALAAMTLFFGCNKGGGIVNNKSVDPNSGSTNTSIDTATTTAVINTNAVQQIIYGFGGADIVDWTGDLTSAQRDSAFSPTIGIGLSLVRVRVPVDSTRFAQAKATIDACKSYDGSAIATAWTAPSWMKTNDSAIGGKIKTTSYKDFANYLKAFNNAVGGLAAISPANEPNITVSYESMQMTASDVADFVAAEGDSSGAPIMAPEPFNMDNNFISTYLNNATAKAKTTFIAGHIYGAKSYNLSVDKPVWMTEHFINSAVSGDDWPNAMNAAKEINDCMNVGWGAYVWWYIRRSYGPISEAGNIQKLGYVMAQYARYIRPGYIKISCTENPYTGIYITAYKSSSKVVVVLINQNAKDVYQKLSISGITVSSCTAYTTTNTSNLVSREVAVSGDNFGFALPASSITTLISN